jgi:hypothetical protein
MQLKWGQWNGFNKANESEHKQQENAFGSCIPDDFKKGTFPFRPIGLWLFSDIV